MEPVALALVDDVPTALTWRSKRFRVADSPTRLSRPADWFYDAVITHPPAPAIRWRFVGRADDGESRVFDVRYDLVHGRWELLRAFD